MKTRSYNGSYCVPVTPGAEFWRFPCPRCTSGGRAMPEVGTHLGAAPPPPRPEGPLTPDCATRRPAPRWRRTPDCAIPASARGAAHPGLRRPANHPHLGTTRRCPRGVRGAPSPGSLGVTHQARGREFATPGRTSSITEALCPRGVALLATGVFLALRCVKTATLTLYSHTLVTELCPLVCVCPQVFFFVRRDAQDDDGD